MAQMMTINLSKGDSPNLGFRLQGGVDFAAPLVIQKVNGGSPADRAGLQAGDAVIKINSTDIFNLRHKDAQDVIIKAGPSFAITVQRGGSTWKPSVVPTGSLSQGAISPVTKTSLAAKPQPSIGAIGTGHNVAAKPFLNGTANGGPKLVNKQYNSPIGLYSEQSIAETLSAQSEVLSTGVLGVNFKKNEKNYDATKSAVYHMLQEAENDPRPEPDQVDSGLTPAISNFGLKHVQAPENKPAPPTPQLPPGQNICADCERLIVGVFVRIKDKNLHVECFKCSTCGASLKNVGYYNINNKLYCDVHAKLAAKANPPGPNLVPVTLPPGNRAPAGTISAALSSHPLPTQAPLSPKIGPASPSTNITAAPFLPDNHLPRKAPPDDLDVNSNHKEDYDNIDAKLLKSLTIAASRKGNANINKITNLTSIGKKPIDDYEAVKSDAVIYESNAVTTKPYGDFAARKAITLASRKSDANFDDNKLTAINNNEANIDEFIAHEANQTKPYRPIPIPYSQFSTKINKAGYTNAPRPFSSVAAPLSPNSYSKPLPRTPVAAPPPSIPTPTSAPVSAPGYFTAKPAGGMPKEHETETEIVCTNGGVQITTKTIEIGRRSPDEYNQINVTIPMPVFSPSLSSSDGSPSPSICSGEGGLNSKITNDYYTSAKNNYLETTFPTRYETAEIRNEATQTNNNNSRSYTCICCQKEFRGPFITALGKIWCPDHFVCATPSCKRPLQDIGFVEEQGQLHCEYCFERYLAPDCSKCNSKIKGDCLKAIGKNFHPECFNCAYCGKLFGNSPFFLEDGLPYCEADWNEMFTTKCFACGFPVEAGDRWVEALNNNYHSQCFNCTMCKKNLEGQSFFAKGGRPFCKNHAR